MRQRQNVPKPGLSRILQRRLDAATATNAGLIEELRDKETECDSLAKQRDDLREQHDEQLQENEYLMHERSELEEVIIAQARSLLAARWMKKRLAGLAEECNVMRARITYHDRDRKAWMEQAAEYQRRIAEQQVLIDGGR